MAGPSLPPELWSDIFALVVHIPGSFFETEWNYTPDELIWEGGWSRTEMTRESLKSRKAIPLVSKAWLAMGRRFVFENLSLENPAFVDSLATLFEQASTERMPMVEGGDNVGSASSLWVKRIEIRSENLFTKRSMPNLARLLRICTNIRILALSTPFRNESLAAEIQGLLHFPFPRTLSRIFVTQLARESDLPTQLLSLPWVTLPSTLFWRSITQTQNSLSRLSVLEITFGDDIGKLRGWRLPSLRYFSICGLTDACVYSLLPFIERNGPQLLGLSLTTDHCSITDKLLDHATGLQTLVLEKTHLSSLRPSLGQTYPTITHLAIAGSYFLDGDDAQIVEDALTRIIPQHFPNLRTIRMLTDYTPSLFWVWTLSMLKAAKSGIRLENRQRRLLQAHQMLPELFQ